MVTSISPLCYCPERHWLMDLSILPSTRIEAEMNSPSCDPTAYWVRGALIALRKEQANLIRIQKVLPESPSITYQANASGWTLLTAVNLMLFSLIHKPFRNLTMPDTATKPFFDLKPGQTATIQHVSDQDPGPLWYLRRNGLIPGASVTVSDYTPYDETLHIQVYKQK